MLKFFEVIGRYCILMGKVFSRPEKWSIYYRRTINEIEQLGINSIPLTAIISVFIGAVIALQMSISLESPFIPQMMIGYATKEVMILATGPKKARAVQMGVEGAYSHVWTITALQVHPKGILVADEDACGELKVNTYKYFKDIEKNNL